MFCEGNHSELYKGQDLCLIKKHIYVFGAQTAGGGGRHPEKR